MKRRLKNPKEAGQYRTELLKVQKGIDPITKEKITRPVLDHFHGGEQHCRGVLQNEVNAFEGKVYNSYKRMLSHITDMPLPEVLRNLADYLENTTPPKDEMVIHHTALTIDTNRFKAMPADVQRTILINLGVEPDTNNKKRCAQARKLIRTGELNIRDIKRDV